MARPGELLITQSLLDRLVDRSKDKDSDYAASGDEAKTRSESFRRYKDGVKRDLEWLLNTRQIPEPAAEGAQQLSKSLYDYGLPDLTAVGLHSARDKDRLLRMLESAVRKFEPRILNAKVTLEPVLLDSRILRFRIDGLLRVDPAPEPVSFNTVLELTSGEYEVK
ncbi:MAG: type VI secretion system baseplate subunit TssE [Acidobacteria bacterium]|jgi:type VI secretion system protein ImpF|nr:MAG: type VI secretion system baseplate subunit TssE [Acidobacteriota bacterium]